MRRMEVVALKVPLSEVSPVNLQFGYERLKPVSRDFPALLITTLPPIAISKATA